MRLRYLAAFIIGFDAFTKAWLTTPAWAQHERTTSWTIDAGVALILPIAMLYYKPLRVAAVLLFCGVFGNLLSALEGDVANPLMVQHGAGQLAFNVADVSLLAAAVAIVVASPIIMRDGTRLMRSRYTVRRAT